MKTTDKISHTISACFDTVMSLARMALLSRRSACKVPGAPAGGEMVVLGNGPSLNDTVAHYPQFLASKHLIAVNFSINSTVTRQLKPQFYILADLHFFTGGNQPNVIELWKNLNAVDWAMTLFIPAEVDTKSIPLHNAYINMVRYNLTPVEGAQWLRQYAYSSGMGMPRPRNVLIPATMLAVRMGYRRVYLAGADHSWLNTLRVDSKNHVVNELPHFYTESSNEAQRSRSILENVKLHEMLYNLHVTFRSYHEIARYIKLAKLDVEVVNVTPDSYIDAFPRADVKDL